MTELVPTYLRYRRESEYPTMAGLGPTDLATIRRALEMLPATCRYHGGNLERVGPLGSPCCDTGKPALYRRRAEALHLTPQPVVDREALLAAAERVVTDPHTDAGDQESWLRSCLYQYADAVLALINGETA